MNRRDEAQSQKKDADVTRGDSLFGFLAHDLTALHKVLSSLVALGRFQQHRISFQENKSAVQIVRRVVGEGEVENEGNRRQVHEGTK
jgi:hypothetical protein